MNRVLCWFFVRFNLQGALQDPPLCYYDILGYLRSRSFPQGCPVFPKKILLSLQFISNYTWKIIQRRRGQCTWSTFPISKDSILQRKWSIITYSERDHDWKNKIKYHYNTLGRSWPLATQDFSSKGYTLYRPLVQKLRHLISLVALLVKSGK